MPGNTSDKDRGFRVVTVHGDEFVTRKKPVIVEEQYSFTGWQVVPGGWHEEKEVLVPVINVRYVEKGRYGFGCRLTPVPPLPAWHRTIM